MLGWLKLTVSAGAMLKVCQFMEALFVDWLMFVVLPDWTMAAVPLVTTPPVGGGKGRGCKETVEPKQGQGE